MLAAAIAASSCISAGTVEAWRGHSTVTAGSAVTRWSAERPARSGGDCGCWPRWCRWPRALSTASSMRVLIRLNSPLACLVNHLFLPVQTLPAFDTEAVSPQVVMTARWADEPSGRIGLQPAFALAAVPDAVLRTQHPPPALTVQDGQVAYRQPECSRLEAPHTALLDQVAIASLGVSERVHGHAQSIARDGPYRLGRRLRRPSRARRTGVDPRRALCGAGRRT
jgi:hypothetical protein